VLLAVLKRIFYWLKWQFKFVEAAIVIGFVYRFDAYHTTGNFTIVPSLCIRGKRERERPRRTHLHVYKIIFA
jgi:hypothetical protein